MAIVYQNDKRAVKFIKDFYKQLTKKTPNQYQVDSILMNFDGDYDNMIMGMYSGLVGKHPTKDQMNQIKNKYGLKKKDSANGLLGSATGESVQSATKKPFKAQEGAFVDPRPIGPLDDSDQDVWDYDPIGGNYSKGGVIVFEDLVPQAIKEALKLKYQEEIDIKNLNKSRKSEEVTNNLKKIKDDTDFQKYYQNPKDTTSVFKSLDLYSKAPNANFDYLLEDEDPENPTKTNAEVVTKPGGFFTSKESVNIEFNNSLKISDRGKDIMRLYDNNSDDDIFMIPKNKIGIYPNEAKTTVGKILKPLRKSGISMLKDLMSDEIKDDGSLPVDSRGLAQFESYMNMDSEINRLQKQQEELLAEGSIDDLSTENQNKYLNNQKVLDVYNLHKQNLYKNILNNASSTSARYFVNHPKTSNLKLKDTQVDLVFTPDDLYKNLVDPNENIYRDVDLEIPRRAANNELLDPYKINTKLNNYTTDFVKENGKFSSKEDMLGNEAFITGLNSMQDRYDDQKTKVVSTLFTINDQITMIGSVGSVDDYTENSYFKIKGLVDRRNEIRLQIQELSEGEQTGDDANRLSNLTTTLSDIDSRIEQLRLEKRTKDEALFDESGAAVDPGLKEIGQGVSLKEKEYLKLYDTGYDEGTIASMLTEQSNDFYAQKQLMEDVFANNKMTLPSGAKMTLGEMRDFLFDAGLREKVRSGYYAGTPIEQEYLDRLLEDEGIAISAFNKLRQLDNNFQGAIIKNIIGPLKGNSKEDVKAMLNYLVNFRGKYNNNITSLMAVENVLAYNVDPGKAWNNRKGSIKNSRLLSQIGESFKESFLKSPIFTDNDVQNNYANIARQKNIPVTELQSKAGETDLPDMLGQGAGSTFYIMGELMLTYPVARFGITSLSKIPKFAKLENAATSTPVGAFIFDMAKDMVAGAAAFEATSGDVVNWRMGAAEGFVQNMFKQMVKSNKYTKALMSVYEKVGKPGLKLSVLGTRVGVGGSAELLAEYAGEFTNNLNKMGYDYKKAFAKTIGETEDERINRLITTAIMCYGMSSAFTLATAGSIDAQLEQMIQDYNDGVGDLSDVDYTTITKYLESSEQYKNSAFGEEVKALLDSDYQTAKEGTPDALKLLNSPSGRYSINGKDVTKRAMESLVNDPTFMQKVKNGSINLRIDDDLDLEKQLDEKFQNTMMVRPDKNGTDYGLTALEANEQEEKDINAADKLIKESLSKPAKESIDQYSKDELYFRMANTQDLYKVYYAGIKSGDWDSVNNFVNNTFNFTKDQLDELKDRFDSDVQEEAEYNRKEKKDLFSDKTDSRNYADALDKFYQDLNIKTNYDLFYNNDLPTNIFRNITEKVKSKYPDIESTIVLEAAANSLEGKPIEVSLTEEQSVIVNALVKEPTIYNISEVMALEVEAGGLNVSDPVDLLKTFTPVQDWMRDIKGMPKTVNKMFSYDYRTKTYKGIINNLNIELTKKPGEPAFVETRTGITMGRTKNEAYQNLVSLLDKNTTTFTSFAEALGRKSFSSTEAGKLMDLVGSARSANKSSIKDPFEPNNSTEAIDSMLKWIDERLEWLARNRDNTIKSDILMGLGTKDNWISLAEALLRSIRSGLKLGKGFSKAVNDAVSKLKMPDGSRISKTDLKNYFLWGQSNIYNKSVKEYESVKGNKKKFINAMEKKYPKQFRVEDVTELHKMIKRSKNPKTYENMYSGSRLKKYQSALKKVEDSNIYNATNVDKQLQPEEIVLNQAGYPKFTKGGKVAFKDFGFELLDAPIFNQNIDRTLTTEQQYQQKVKFTSNVIFSELQNLPAVVSQSGMNLNDFMNDSVGWYRNTREIVQEKFGPFSNMYFELLGASSAQVTPEVNVQKTDEALRLYSQGKLNKALEIYDESVNYILKEYELGGMTLLNAQNKIISASSDARIVEEIEKARNVLGSNGRPASFGAAANGAIIRVLYGNWIGFEFADKTGTPEMLSKPALKTAQFYNNLSQRDHNATIDVWMGRFGRRALYDSAYKQTGSQPTGPVYWRRRQPQERGVSDPDFKFMQDVLRDLTSTRDLRSLFGVDNIEIEDVQAVIWQYEQTIWDTMGFRNIEKLTTMDSKIKANGAVERLSVGASAFMGQDKEMHMANVYNKLYPAIQRGATDEELIQISMQTLKGSVRFDQAKKNMEEAMQSLNPLMSKVEITEGVYNNQAEPNITTEAVIPKGADISVIVNQAMDIGYYNGQTSVFVSRTTSQDHPNARPYRRIEFDSPLTNTDKEFLVNALNTSGISGYSFNYNQQKQIVGVEFQLIPEYAMNTKSFNNIDDIIGEENWINSQNKFDQDAESVREKLENNNIKINYFEKNYVNTKVFTNGEYKTIKEKNKSFDTDLRSELTRRQSTLDLGFAAEDISDVRKRHGEDARSVPRFQKLITLAEKLDALYNSMLKDGHLYTDFGFRQALMTAIKLASISLRTTADVGHAIDRAIKYLKDTGQHTSELEFSIKEFFKNEIFDDYYLHEQNPKTSIGDVEVTEESELTEEEQKELDEKEALIDQQSVTSINSSKPDGYTTEEANKLDKILESNIDNSYRNKSTNAIFTYFLSQAQQVVGRLKTGQVGSLRSALMEGTVDSRYFIRKSLELAARKYDLEPQAMDNLMSLIRWNNSPGTARHYADKFSNPIFYKMSSDQIKELGTIMLLRRVIVLDEEFDRRKLVLDEVIKEINQKYSIIDNLKNSRDKAKGFGEPTEESKGITKQIRQTERDIRILVTQAKNLYPFSEKGEDGKIKDKRVKMDLVLDETSLTPEYKLVLVENGEYMEVEVPAGLQMKNTEGDLNINPWRLLHPKLSLDGQPRTGEVLSKETAQAILDGKKTNPEFEFLNKKADEVFSVHKDLLKRKWENGLIDTITYSTLRELDYIPRRFIHHSVISEDNVINIKMPGTVKVHNVANPLKEIGLGSDEVLYTDPVKLLEGNIGSTFSVLATNEALKGIYDTINIIEKAQLETNPKRFGLARVIFGEYENNPIPVSEVIGYTVTKDKPYVPEYNNSINGATNQYYLVPVRINGDVKKMALTEEAYQSLFNRPGLNQNIDNLLTVKGVGTVLRFNATLANYLKTFATGNLGIYFFLNNARLDMTQQVQFSDSYNYNFWSSKLLPLKYLTAVADWASVSREAFSHVLNVRKMGRIVGEEPNTPFISNVNKTLRKLFPTSTPLVDEYFLNGGNLDFFHTQGINSENGNVKAYKDPLEQYIDKLQKEQGLTYNQAVEVANQASLSGQIVLDPDDQPFSDPNKVNDFRRSMEYLGSLNQWSELMGRLANMQRWKSTYIKKFRKENGRDPNEEEYKEIVKLAVANAVDYANFNRGGSTVKSLDRKAGFAYLNAGLQVMYSRLKYANKNRAQFGWDLAQSQFIFYAAVAFSLSAAFRLYRDEDEKERIDKELDKNFMDQNQNKFYDIRSIKKLEKMYDKAVASGNTTDAEIINNLIKLREQEEDLLKQDKENTIYLYDKVSEYDKRNHTVVMLPWSGHDYLDPEKEQRLKVSIDSLRSEYLDNPTMELSSKIRSLEKERRLNTVTNPSYLKLPTDLSLDFVKLPAQDLAYQNITGRPSTNTRKDYLDMLRKSIPIPTEGVLASNPGISALYKIYGNYDLWREEEVWRKDPNVTGPLRMKNLSSEDDQLVKALSTTFDYASDFLGDGRMVRNFVDPLANTQNLKEGLGSVFTSLDRNPWYQTFNNIYTVGGNVIRPDADKIETDKAFIEFTEDFFGPAKDRFIGKVNVTEREVDPLVENTKTLVNENAKVSYVFRQSFNEVSREMGVTYDRQNKTYVDREGKIFTLPIDERGELREEYKDKTLPEIMQTLDNVMVVEALNRGTRLLKDEPGFINTHVFDKNDFKGWLRDYHRNITYASIENETIANLIRQYRDGDKNRSAITRVLLQETSDKPGETNVAIARAFDDMGIEITKDEEYNRYYKNARKVFREYKDVLRMPDGQEKKLKKDSIEKLPLATGFLFEDLIKDANIPLD